MNKTKSHMMPGLTQLPSVRDFLFLLSIACVYFIIARLSLAFFVIKPEGIAAICPPSGIFLAAILLSRRELKPWLAGLLFSADFIAEMLAGTPYVLSIVYAMALTGDGLLAAWLLLKFVADPFTLKTVREVSGFILLAVFCSNSFMSLAAAAGSSFMLGGSFWVSWKWWAISDGIGSVLVTPFIICFATMLKRGAGFWNPGRVAEGLILAVLLFLVYVFVFICSPGDGHLSALATYFILPFLLWATIRFGFCGITSALLVLAAFAMSFTIISLASLSPVYLYNIKLEPLIVVQLYLAAIAIPFLFLAAVVSERKQAYDDLEQEQGFLSALLDNIQEAIVACDDQGKLVRFNEAARKLHGLNEQPISPEHWATQYDLFKTDGRTLLNNEEVPLYQALHGRKISNVEIVVAPRHSEPRMLTTNGQAIKTKNGQISGAVIAMHDITESKRIEKELTENNEELIKRNRIISTLTGIHGGVEPILDVLLAITGLEGGTICQVSSDDHLHLIARRVASKTEIQGLATNVIKIGDCLCGECVRSHKPLILSDREAVSQFSTPRACCSNDVSFHASFPLVAADKCLGVLCLFSQADAKPAKADLRLIESLAPQMALAVENIQLYNKTLRHSAILEKKIKERTENLIKNQQALLNVVDDINEKSAALAAANEKLKEVDRLKSMFIATMSHELRTPLNSIIGFSSILREEWLGPVNDAQKENLTDILDSGKHLLSLINDVIDLSKVEAGILASVQKTFELKTLVEEAVRTVSNDVAGKGLVLSTDIADLKMNTDRRRLLQCLLNLLSNAVKFTEKGEITVTACPVSNGQEMVAIKIADSGIGISHEDFKQLFKPFVRLHMPGDTRYPGTGLGLYLTAKLAREVLGGEVTVNSEVNRGSVFTLRIPLEKSV